VKLYIVSAKVVQYHRQGVHANSPQEALAALRDWKHWSDESYIETDEIELDPDPDEIEEDGA
jgi:site-specific recombinase XerC